MVLSVEIETSSGRQVSVHECNLIVRNAQAAGAEKVEGVPNLYNVSKELAFDNRSFRLDFYLFATSEGGTQTSMHINQLITLLSCMCKPNPTIATFAQGHGLLLSIAFARFHSAGHLGIIDGSIDGLANGNHF